MSCLTAIMAFQLFIEYYVHAEHISLAFAVLGSRLRPSTVRAAVEHGFLMNSTHLGSLDMERSLN